MGWVLGFLLILLGRVEVGNYLNASLPPATDGLAVITGAPISGEAVTRAGNPPLELNGVQVLVDGRPQPLRTVAPAQIVFVCTAKPGAHWLLLRTPSRGYLSRFIVARTAPGVFLSAAPGDQSNFIPLGYATTDGKQLTPLTSQPLTVGQGEQPTIISVLTSGLRHAARPPRVRLNGVSCDGVSLREYFLAGVDELTFTIPPYLVSNGAMDLTIETEGGAANFARLVLGPATQ